MTAIIDKRTLKHLIPHTFWRCIRHELIVRRQHHNQRLLGRIVDKFDDSLLAEVKPLKQLPDNKIIWQYWAQGFESSSMPSLINVCLQSVDKYTQDFILIRISEENINDYIEIPAWLLEKKRHMSKAHFADLLRCILLSCYGGLWLDAATFLTGHIPSYIYSSEFFMYQRDDEERYKKYWEGTFAYYWGWSSKFLVRALIGIMYAEKGNKTISDLASVLLTFWKNNTSAPDYFFFQIMIETYFRKNPGARPAIVNDTIPHLLRQYINGYPVPGYSLSDILQKTTVHSLNYKNEGACGNLSAIFPEYKA